MAINFTKLVQNIISEKLTGNTFEEQLLNLLRSNQTYISSIPDEASEEQVLDSLFDLAWRINYGTGYNSAKNSEIARNRAFWPIIDFLTDVLPNYLKNPREELKSLDINQPLENLVTKQNVDINSLINAAEKLLSPETYSSKNRRISDVKYNTANLAGEKYKNNTPLDGVLNAIRVVKGYNENEVIDIMKYPRKYDLPASIKLNELLPIRRISQSLYLFYVNRLKSSLYTPTLQMLIPVFANLTKDQINDIIDNSVGLTGPKNRELQQDYEQFLNGKSRLLVKLIAENKLNFDNFYSSIIEEDVNPSSWKPSAQNQPQTQPQPQQQTTQQTTQQTNTSKSWKPTNEPVIKSINDFKQGIGNDQQIEDAYTDFYNTLTKGTTPSGWQRAGSAFNSFLKGLEDIGDTLSKL